MNSYAKNILLIFILAFLVSCEKEDATTVCDVVNPVENLPWLKAMIESWDATTEFYTFQYVVKGKYMEQTVFVVGNCCPYCDSIFPVYNCSGELLPYSTLLDITEQKIIWKPINSQCTL